MTEAALLLALAEARHLEDEGFTVQELCVALGRSERKVRSLLKQAIEEGKVRVTKKHITDISGRVQVVPAYIAC